MLVRFPNPLTTAHSCTFMAVGEPGQVITIFSELESPKSCLLSCWVISLRLVFFINVIIVVIMIVIRVFIIVVIMVVNLKESSL